VGVLVSSFFLNLPYALLTAVAWGLVAFVGARIVKRHATMDVFWGAGFLAVYLESLFVSHQLSRSRYVTIMKGANGRNETLYALKTIYGLQGLLIWFVALPLQWVAFSKSFDGLVVVGLVLVAIGVYFEAVGDEQLRRFIKNPANAGTTMSRGLWRYTRHPTTSVTRRSGAVSTSSRSRARVASSLSSRRSR
jgi:steroid 5-alpha reductase family enzyme